MCRVKEMDREQTSTAATDWGNTTIIITTSEHTNTRNTHTHTHTGTSSTTFFSEGASEENQQQRDSTQKKQVE